MAAIFCVPVVQEIRCWCCNPISVEPKHVNGNYALGMVYGRAREWGNRTAAMQQYYILQYLDARIAADLLKAIPNQ